MGTSEAEMLMFEIRDFSKKYEGAKKYSAYKINLKVNDGEVCGLVGSNGAGKSTLIKSMTGILPYSEGTIIINGYDLRKQGVKAKKNVGYVPDDHTVYDKLTGREYVNLMGSMYGVKKRQKQAILDSLAARFNLTHALDDQISSYSHGMKQKICMMGSLVHDPALWILDEPMLGLDPTTMNAVSEFMREYAAKGGAVLFSTHNLDAVRRICDRAIVIRGGLIEADMSVRGIGDSELLERFFLHGAEAEE